MRKREVVKIDSKEYTVKELTVEEILDLMNNSTFFGGDSLKDKGVEEQEEKKDDIGILLGDVKLLMEKSCDFEFDDLKKLAPSEIKLLYDGWNKANSDFLSIVKVLGFSEILSNIKDAVLSNFSNLLVTSLKQGM